MRVMANNNGPAMDVSGGRTSEGLSDVVYRAEESATHYVRKEDGWYRRNGEGDKLISYASFCSEEGWELLEEQIRRGHENMGTLLAEGDDILTEKGILIFRVGGGDSVRIIRRKLERIE